MQLIDSSETGNLTPCAATVGFFDGVHAGHRFLIEELKSIAKLQNLKSRVFTFAVHPRKVLKQEFRPEILTTLPEKLVQLESTGIDGCVVLNFTLEMAKLSAYEFLKELKERFNVQTLLVGHDHRFGHNRAEGFPEYEKYGEALGMKVLKATEFNTELDKNISSSEIRNALKNGDIELTNRLLTYEYSLFGEVIEGFRVGRKIGYPTANLVLQDPDKLIPAIGVYAVRVLWNNHHYKGMMNIGRRPTLENGQNISLEVHILDFDTDIYNQFIQVDFIQKIRDEQKFNGLEELKEQLQKDKQAVSALF